MATAERLVKSIRSLVENIFKFDIENQLVRERELKEFGFSAKRDEFEDIKSRLQVIEGLDLKVVPVHILAEFNALLTQLLSVYHKLENFNTGPRNNPQELYNLRDGLQVEFELHYLKVLEFILNAANAVRTFSRDSDNDDVNKARERVRTVNEESDKALQQINTVLQTLQTKAKEFGISKYADSFQKESERHMGIAKWWLSLTYILIAAIIGYCFWFTTELDEVKLNNNNYVLLLSITRLIIATALFLAVSQSIRNYKSHKHNEVVNRHRHNALTTFETFSTAASGDEQTKNAVLLEATRSIFSNQSTGYSNTDRDVEVPANKVFEIFRSTKHDQ